MTGGRPDSVAPDGAWGYCTTLPSASALGYFGSPLAGLRLKAPICNGAGYAYDSHLRKGHEGGARVKAQECVGSLQTRLGKATL